MNPKDFQYAQKGQFINTISANELKILIVKYINDIVDLLDIFTNQDRIRNISDAFINYLSKLQIKLTDLDLQLFFKSITYGEFGEFKKLTLTNLINQLKGYLNTRKKALSELSNQDQIMNMNYKAELIFRMIIDTRDKKINENDYFECPVTLENKEQYRYICDKCKIEICKFAPFYADKILQKLNSFKSKTN